MRVTDLGNGYMTRERDFSVRLVLFNLGKLRKRFGTIPGVEVGTWWETRSVCLVVYRKEIHSYFATELHAAQMLSMRHLLLGLLDLQLMVHIPLLSREVMMTMSTWVMLCKLKDIRRVHTELWLVPILDQVCHVCPYSKICNQNYG